MRYSKVSSATFIERPNRFIAKVNLDGEEVTVHVKNTSRCTEVLIPGAEVILAHSDNPNRKTKHDLVSVYKGDLLINIDSQAPNKVYGEALASGRIYSGDLSIRPEKTYGDSRFDFYLEKEGKRNLTEVKGVTLENDGIVQFPGAPTERGVKHLRGLIRSISEGFDASVVFIVQMSEADHLIPNYEMHEEFGVTLEEAVEAGVEVTAYKCDVTEDSLELSERIPVKFRNGFTL